MGMGVVKVLPLCCSDAWVTNFGGDVDELGRILQLFLHKYIDEAFVCELCRVWVHRLPAEACYRLLKGVVLHESMVDILFGGKGEERRAALAGLLLACFRCNGKEVCTVKMLRMVAGAYRMTLSTADQRLFQLLAHFDGHGYPLSLIAFQVSLPADQIGRNEGLYTPLESAAIVLHHIYQGTIVDTKALRKAAESYPTYRSMSVEEVPPQPCLDPAFLLRLFTFALESTAHVDLLRLYSSGVLGYTLIAATSACKCTLAFAQGLLGAFYALLSDQSMRFPQLKLLLYKLGHMRYPLEMPYAAACAVLCPHLFTPSHYLTDSIQRFVLHSAQPLQGEIPLFSFHLQHAGERGDSLRKWSMRQLRECMNGMDVYEMAIEAKVVDQIFQFMDSGAAGEGMRLQMIATLRRFQEVGGLFLKKVVYIQWYLQRLRSPLVDMEERLAFLEILLAFQPGALEAEMVAYLRDILLEIFRISFDKEVIRAITLHVLTLLQPYPVDYPWKDLFLLFSGHHHLLFNLFPIASITL